MNLLFIHANGIVPTAGGISRTTANLAQLMRKNGHNVWFIGAKDIHSNTEYDSNQSFLPSTTIDSIENETYLRLFLKTYNIKIIINQNPFGIELVCLLHKCTNDTGVKVVACYHNSILTPIIRYAYCHEFKLREKHLGWLFNLLRWKPVANLLVFGYIVKWRKSFCRTVSLSDAVILLCDGQVNELLRMCGYKSCEKVYVIPNCLPDQTVMMREKQKCVVWTGTFDYIVKRPDLMLSIWEKVTPQHPEWSLYMLGDGPSLQSMKSLVQSKEIKNVIFTGRVNPTKYYEASEIQCMTSVHEAFPMVSIEAMGHDAAVIAFNSFTSAPYIIDDKRTGLLVKPFSLKEYVAALNHLMSDDTLRKEMGITARQSVKRFSEDAIYAKWIELFEQLCKNA